MSPLIDVLGAALNTRLLQAVHRSHRWSLCYITIVAALLQVQVFVQRVIDRQSGQSITPLIDVLGAALNACCFKRRTRDIVGLSADTGLPQG